MRSLIALISLGLLAGCSTEEQSTTGTGNLFVSTSTQISRFARATNVAGDIVPASKVAGSQTRLSQPGYLTYDEVNDRLYVPNGGDNSILVFNNFRAARENVPPARIISGPNTGLNRPVQIELDTGRDLMYVANAGSSSLTVYSNASTIQGAVAPVRTLSGAGTQFGGITSIELDVQGDRLWVANGSTGSLLVFNNISTLNGGPPPARIISGANTRLQSPQFLLRDGQRLYVANGGGMILRFENIDGLNGSIAPTGVITGQLTGLVRPQQMQLRPDRDELYVADGGAGAVLVFATPATANGAPAPLRRLAGSRTNLSDVTGLVLDLEEEAQ